MAYLLLKSHFATRFGSFRHLRRFSSRHLSRNRPLLCSHRRLLGTAFAFFSCFSPFAISASSAFSSLKFPLTRKRGQNGLFSQLKVVLFRVNCSMCVRLSRFLAKATFAAYRRLCFFHEYSQLSQLIVQPLTYSITSIRPSPPDFGSMGVSPKKNSDSPHIH